MPKKANLGMLTKVFAVIGTVLVLLPIFFAVVTGIIGSISSGRFLFDYLIPAEAFPIILVGTILLIGAAIRAHSHRKQIIWGFIAMLILLFSFQAIAVVTGLASGETEPTGWPWAMVIAGLVLFWAAIIETGISGILLVRHCIKNKSL